MLKGLVSKDYGRGMWKLKFSFKFSVLFCKNVSQWLYWKLFVFQKGTFVVFTNNCVRNHLVELMKVIVSNDAQNRIVKFYFALVVCKFLEHKCLACSEPIKNHVL